MANKKEIRALITLAGKVDPSLQSALLKASGESMKIKTNLDKANQGLNKAIFRGTFLGNLAADGFRRVASGIMRLASDSLGYASDLREVQNVVDTTFKDSAKVIDAWSKQALNSYGLTELQAKQYSGVLGAMLKSSNVAHGDMLKMSQDLAGLAGDFASFYNLDHETAFQKIRAGLSGETEPLKQLGIDMSVTNLQAFMLSKGIKSNFTALDAASKANVRYAYLMEKSKDAQGDFAKTQGEHANQVRLFRSNLQKLGATLAEKVLPYVTKLLQKGNELMTSGRIDGYIATVGGLFDGLGNAIKWVSDNSEWLIPIMAGVTGGLAAYSIVGTVKDLMEKLALATKGQTIVQWALNAAMHANPVFLIAAGMGLAIAAGVALIRNWDKVKEKAAELAEKIKKFLGPIGKLFGSGSANLELQASVKPENIYDTMPMYSKGGFANRPSIFGEDGPEAAIPLKRTPRSLLLLNRTAEAIGAGPAGSSLSLTYAPVIYGGNRAELEPLLQQHKSDIQAMIEDYFAGKARVSFA